MEAVIDEDIEALESLEQPSLTESKIAVMDDNEPEADENLIGDEKLFFAEAQSMLQKCVQLLYHRESTRFTFTIV
jgi:hypothetical protein